MHLPRFSSGEGGDNDDMEVAWKNLANGGTSVVLVGHDHLYERFAPLSANGDRDEANGIRSFTVGTGGAYLDSQPWWTDRHSDALIARQWGVLQLELAPDRYRWSFINTDGQVLDEGQADCRQR